MASRSAIVPGPVGFHPSFSRVIALDDGMSCLTNIATNPKCPSTFRRDADHRHLQHRLKPTIRCYPRQHSRGRSPVTPMAVDLELIAA